MRHRALGGGLAGACVVGTVVTADCMAAVALTIAVGKQSLWVCSEQQLLTSHNECICKVRFRQMISCLIRESVAAFVLRTRSFSPYREDPIVDIVQGPL